MARQEPHVKKRSLRKRNMTLWHKHCCRGKWATPEEFEDSCREYFDESRKSEESFTFPGLCLFLNISKQGFYDQSAKGVDWARVVDWAKLVIEDQLEKDLMGKDTQPGAKMRLINRYRGEWSDRSQTEITGNDGAPFNIIIQKFCESDSDDE